MNISHPLGLQANSVAFSCYTPEELRKLSVKEIFNPATFDEFGLPVPSGSYDPALGPFSQNSVCATCYLDQFNCPGHFGHIELPCPVYNPLFFNHIIILLKAICVKCHRFRISEVQNFKYIAKLKLLNHGLLLESKQIDYIGQSDLFEDFKSDIKSNKDVFKCSAVNAERKLVIAELLAQCNRNKNCPYCDSHYRTFKKEGYSKIFLKPLPLKIQRLESARNDVPQNRDADDDMEIDDELVGNEKANDPKKSKKNLSQEPLQSSTLSNTENKYVTPEIIRSHFRQLFTNESELCSCLYNMETFPISQFEYDNNNKALRADIFFLEVIGVTPVRFRPISVLEEMAIENSQTIHFTRILKARKQLCYIAGQFSKDKENILENSVDINESIDNLMNYWVNLQDAVNGLFDSSKGIYSGIKDPPPGIKQVLEKKEGLFRKHLMGKRVNYSARSVISPDPNVDTDEIGIPMEFAKKLTFPEPVTIYNIKRLSKAVTNGPNIWPGATHIQHEDGSLTNLSMISQKSRNSIGQQLLNEEHNKSSFTQYRINTQFLNKKVFRHLDNGDILLLNRQPTLHKPSIMAHRARILKGEMTIRMHYVNCKPYNADFDGDEMNVHFPQNEVAQTEAKMIGNANKQYLGPTTGSPLRGLIQDHVVTGVWLTCKDTFLTKGEYQQLLFTSLKPDPKDSRKILNLHPAIIKPKELWTGKQLISTILYNMTYNRQSLNLTSKNNVSDEQWGWSGKEEGTVIFLDGELLVGILDKSQFGTSAYGFIHSCYEIYSDEIAGQLLSMLGRLFTAYVQMKGFSCRMDDLQLNTDGDIGRKNLLNSAKNIGRNAAFEYVKMDYNTVKDSIPTKNKEFVKAMEEVFRDPEKYQGLETLMKSRISGLTTSVISTWAKGSKVNAAQISCCLGQQELEGKRVPMMISGRSLPSFMPYDPSAIAGGFIGGRFLTGIKPQEYFFHCMAGREGLIDTAVKTSRSGYLQRCLIKHLESLCVHYDHTVRDGDGSVIQFHYGEDSLDVTKQKHLYEFKFNAQNYKSLIENFNILQASEHLDISTASYYAKMAAKQPNKFDPVLSKFSPSKHLGSVSEKFSSKLEEYIKENPDNILDNNNSNSGDDLLSKVAFRKLMHFKYLNSLVEPGEAVGLLAAQGIGEPSTQMTLNTFHFAGFGEMNVTLGIPRLREIIMTASRTIKTPMMKLTVLDGVSDTKISEFCQSFSKLTLSEVIDKMTVTEYISRKRDGSGSLRNKIYRIRMDFFPRNEYKEEFNVDEWQIKEVIEKIYIPRLEVFITKELKKFSKNVDDSTNFDKLLKKAKESDKQFNEDEDVPSPNFNGNESDDGDGDATTARINKRTKQHASYDAPDEDDLEVIKQNDDELDKIDLIVIDDEEEDDGENDNQNNNKLSYGDGNDASSSDGYGDDGDNNDNYMIQDLEINENKEKIKKKIIDETFIKNKIITNSLYASNYEFDDKDGGWCEIELMFPAGTRKILLLPLAEMASKMSVIHEVRGVTKCQQITNDNENDKTKSLVTNGVNFQSLWKYDKLIDINNIYSNDIAAILKTYGVEAARMAIIREISEVFGLYGIKIDIRHLSLVADYMTFDGKYKPFNRIGIDSNASPFLKMSFETTCNFLTQATLYSDNDLLQTPSSRLVFGKVVQGGTGSFEVRYPCDDIKFEN
ncbi:2484_t:CDS:10 [Entrophospora sp. SA101]|nr:2484_t:CDS:10 [Entrophospora sp. SA101]